MITVMNKPINEMEKCLDPQLWHACAGGMVQMPALNSKIFYFPQGHLEHAHEKINFRNFPKVPHLILCSVSSIKFLADPDTDEVFSKIKLIPIKNNEPNFDGDNNNIVDLKPASFAKTLTQSDANNGGGFSVPRYCAETIFPPLDYSADPPVQTLVAKDVHGIKWKFRHIYRGTPRRHLLTTGWSNFVNQKKLVAGDSIVFLRAENGDLCVGIRRAKRRFFDGSEISSGWNPIGGNSYLRDNGNGENGNINGRVKIEFVFEAANLAVKGEPFEVIYYPRANAPEFCVKASSVFSAMKIQWSPGMRFKMPFETEDSSRISWFMGTISSVQIEDPVHWPNSPWRVLMVSWDEPDLLQNVKRVSPWLVELVSSFPPIPYPSLSPPRKKMRVPPPIDFPFVGQFPTMASFLSNNNPLRPNSSPAAGIQGARHALFGLPSSSHQFTKLPPPSPSINCKNIQDISSFLSIGITHHDLNKKYTPNSQKPKFSLFGQPILTEDQISQNTSSSSEGILEKSQNLSDGSGSTVVQNGPLENTSDDGKSVVGLETVSY